MLLLMRFVIIHVRIYLLTIKLNYDSESTKIIYLTDLAVGRLRQSADSLSLRDATRLQREVAVTYRIGEEMAKCRSCFDANAVRLIRDAVWVRMSMKELLLKLDFLNGVDDVAYGCLQE
jgi:hypothetical protein